MIYDFRTYCLMLIYGFVQKVPIGRMLRMFTLPVNDERAAGVRTADGSSAITANLFVLQ